MRRLLGLRAQAADLLSRELAGAGQSTLFWKILRADVAGSAVGNPKKELGLRSCPILASHWHTNLSVRAMNRADLSQIASAGSKSVWYYVLPKRYLCQLLPCWLDACSGVSRANFRHGESVVGGLDPERTLILWLKF
jgi:hypothetical protein